MIQVLTKRPMLSALECQGVDLPVQLVTFDHSERAGYARTPSARRMKPILNRAIWNKPYGGFWTSSFTGDDSGSAWEQWRIGESFGDGAVKAWTLVPALDARVLRIDRFRDFLDFHAVYGVPNPYHIAGIDFERPLADGWDAIWLTERGQHQTRFSDPGLYGWDVESLLWLKWAFIGDAEPIPVTWWRENE